MKLEDFTTTQILREIKLELKICLLVIVEARILSSFWEISTFGTAKTPKFRKFLATKNGQYGNF